MYVQCVGRIGQYECIRCGRLYTISVTGYFRLFQPYSIAVDGVGLGDSGLAHDIHIVAAVRIATS
jgi:hypothetical protein